MELGTLAGYSGVWIARGLANGGRLITVEPEPTHADFARAVKATLPYMRFRPAMFANRLVPQLVQQPFAFRIQDTATSRTTRPPGPAGAAGPAGAGGASTR